MDKDYCVPRRSCAARSSRLAGNCPTKMEVLMAKSSVDDYRWWIFPAMLHWRVHSSSSWNPWGRPPKSQPQQERVINHDQPLFRFVWNIVKPIEKRYSLVLLASQRPSIRSLASWLFQPAVEPWEFWPRAARRPEVSALAGQMPHGYREEFPSTVQNPPDPEKNNMIKLDNSTIYGWSSE